MLDNDRLIVESERLRLRLYTLDDTDFIINLLNQPSFIENIGDRGIRTKDDAEQYLQKSILNSYQKHGFGLSMVELKESGTAIGMCGILKRDTLEHPDLGYAFLPEYCGQGYAFEIADRLMKSVEELYGLKRVLAITSSDNSNSIRLLEKTGFKFEGMIKAVEDQPENKLFSFDC
jgi:RimJ/RimL family protein N-acetyltransferase